jgi:hypothetical protein
MKCTSAFKLLLCLVLNSCFSLSLIAQDVVEEKMSKDLEQTKELDAEKIALIKRLKVIATSRSEDFLNDIDVLKTDVFNYISFKKKECLGEFSSVITNDLGDKEVVKRKLTKEEKKICLIELKLFNAFYINQTFESRKTYLTRIHKDQMIQLEVLKDEMLDDNERKFKEIEIQRLRTRRRRRNK